MQENSEIQDSREENYDKNKLFNHGRDWQTKMMKNEIGSDVIPTYKLKDLKKVRAATRLITKQRRRREDQREDRQEDQERISRVGEILGTQTIPIQEM